MNNEFDGHISPTIVVAATMFALSVFGGLMSLLWAMFE